MKQAIGYLRQSTTKQQSSSSKQTIKVLAENIIFNTLPFIAINNQDVLISGMVINKLLN